MYKEIRGPFSYSGNKYRIWNKHLKDIFSNFNKIHEPFLGSGVCLYNSLNGGIGIDTDENVVALHNALSNVNLVKCMENTYAKYFETGRTKENYLKLRSTFNTDWKLNGINADNVHMLHLLIQLSFNSLLRFSKNGFNVPIGMKEVDFDRIRRHQQIFNTNNISIKQGNYSDLDLNKVDKDNDLIYVDPPYIASKFKYGGWEKEDEIKLLEYIDTRHNQGYKCV